MAWPEQESHLPRRFPDSPLSFPLLQRVCPFWLHRQGARSGRGGAEPFLASCVSLHSSACLLIHDACGQTCGGQGSSVLACTLWLISSTFFCFSSSALACQASSPMARKASDFSSSRSASLTCLVVPQATFMFCPCFLVLLVLSAFCLFLCLHPPSFPSLCLC